MKKKPTIKEIAHVVGVSTTTISRYLNGNYGKMSTETKESIKQVIAELDYEPNSLARALKTNKSGMIGFIVSDIMQPSFQILSKSIYDVCTNEGYQLMIANSDNDKFKEKEFLKSMSEYNFEGLIINHTGKNTDYLLELKEEGNKFVLINQEMQNRSFNSISTNNREATQEVIKSLFEKGYTDVYYLCNEAREENFYSITKDEKYWGFRLACQKCREDKDIKLIAFSGTNIDDRFQPIYENYRTCKIALFCDSIEILLQTLTHLKQKEIKIPEQIGILGFDDATWHDTATYDINLIQMPVYRVGCEASKLLISEIKGERGNSHPVHLILKNQYLEGNSI